MGWTRERRLERAYVERGAPLTAPRSCPPRSPPTPLTQRVGDACLHVVGADMANPVLVLRLGQHRYADVPEGVDGDLAGRTRL